MAELTPMQKARRNYEERLRQNPILKSKREKQLSKSTANSHVKFKFDLEDLYEHLELTIALILIRENTNFEELNREQRKEFLKREKPQAFLSNEQLDFIGEISSLIHKHKR